MNKYISNILIVLGIVTLSLIFVGSASAEYPTYQDCANSTWTTPVGCDKVLDRYYAGYYSNGYDYVATTHQNTYNNQPNQYNQPVAYANPAPLTTTPIINNYYYKDESVTAKSTTNTTTKSSTSGSTTTKTNTSASTQKESDVKSDTSNTSNLDEGFSGGSELTALSFSGSGGFLPSSFWQWLLVAILILVIIILARLIRRASHKEEYSVPVH